MKILNLTTLDITVLSQTITPGQHEAEDFPGLVLYHSKCEMLWPFSALLGNALLAAVGS